MATLTKNDIEDKIINGWRRDDFFNLCPVPSHKGKVNKLLYDPKGEWNDGDIIERCLQRQSSIMLHIGEMVGLKKNCKSSESITVPQANLYFFLQKKLLIFPLMLKVHYL